MKDTPTQLISVQQLYKPVFYEYGENLPPIPQQDEMGLSEYLEAKDWWDEQLKRCLYGWTAPNGVYLNPKLYFYLNFVKIPVLDHNNNVLDKTRPLYLQNDHATIDSIHYGEANKFKNADDYIIAKARRKHWTFNTHCCILLWDFIFDHNSNCGIGYPDDDYLVMGKLYFLEAYDSVHQYFKADKIYPNNLNEVGYASSRPGGKAITHNMLYFYPVGKRPGKFRGKALKRLLFDEVGVLTNLLDCLNAGFDCVRLGSKKFGQILLGGTSDMITNKSTDYKDIWDKAEHYNIKRIFIPAYEMMEGHIDYDTGASSTQTALQTLLDRREQKRLSGNQKFYESEIQENPISEEECFIATGKSLFDIERINQQMIVNKQNNVEKDMVCGRFEWIYDVNGQNTRRVEFVESPDGKAKIYLPHLPSNENGDLFVAGIDDYYKDVSLYSDSKGCCMIYIEPSHRNISSDAPAALYLDRPNTRLEFLENCLKMCVFFNIGFGKLMIENNDNVIEKFYVDNNYGYMLKWVNKDIGVRLSESIKNSAIRLGEQYIAQGRLKGVFFNEILDGIKKVRRGNEKKALNTDIGSTMLLIWLLLDTYKYEFEQAGIASEYKKEALVSPVVKFAFTASNDGRQNTRGDKPGSLFTFSGR